MTFLSEEPIRSVRKEHICAGCDKHIFVGETACKYTGIEDGGAYSLYFHHECRAAEIDLNNRHNTRPGDEWISGLDLDREDRKWAKANHSIFYRRLNMTRSQHKAAKYGGLDANT